MMVLQFLGRVSAPSYWLMREMERIVVSMLLSLWGSRVGFFFFFPFLAFLSFNFFFFGGLVHKWYRDVDECNQRILGNSQEKIFTGFEEILH